MKLRYTLPLLFLLGGCAKKGATDASAAYEEIAQTGIAEFDAVFDEVATIHATLADIELDIQSSKADVAESLGLASDTDFSAALDELVAQAKGNLSVTVDGWRPQVSTTADAPPEVQDAVNALNAGMEDVAEAVEKTQVLPEQVAALVEKASAFPGQVDKDILEKNGVAVTEVLSVAKTTKNNLSATRATDDRIAAVQTELTSYPQLVIDSLTGAGVEASEGTIASEPKASEGEEAEAAGPDGEGEATEGEAETADETSRDIDRTPVEEREEREDGTGKPKTTISKPTRKPK